MRSARLVDDMTGVELARRRQQSWLMDKKTFLRHYLEMVAAMVVGMLVLDPVWQLSLGSSGILDVPELAALIMATNMTAGMVLWMRYRGHSWASNLEMAAAMYVPFVVLFVPYWMGAFDGEVMLIAGHVLMLPCMLLVMLRRRAEYSRQHEHGHA
jgi:hypothetical protein